jgi:hypothetical protein
MQDQGMVAAAVTYLEQHVHDEYLVALAAESVERVG